MNERADVARRKVGSPQWAVCTALCCAVAWGANHRVMAFDGASGTQDPTPGISAQHVRYHMPGNVEITRALVELSEAGLRVRQMGQGRDAWQMLESFTDGNLWLIDRGRSISYQLPTAVRLGPSAKLEPESAAGFGDATTGFLGSEPCLATAVASVRPGKWRNRAVQAYECLPDAGGLYTVELLDTQWDIVSYRRSSDGQVDELQGLRAQSFPSSRFRPETDLRAVSEAEFFGGVPRIGRYIEPEDPR